MIGEGTFFVVAEREEKIADEEEGDVFVVECVTHMLIRIDKVAMFLLSRELQFFAEHLQCL